MSQNRFRGKRKEAPGPTKASGPGMAAVPGKEPNKAEYSMAGGPAWPPTHPGALLREDVLPALSISITDVAAKLGVSRQALHNLLAEKAAVTPEMALRLGKLWGNGPALWLRMQQARDLWQAERDLAEELQKIPTLGAD
jgi:antitoxin HigA-1